VLLLKSYRMRPSAAGVGLPIEMVKKAAAAPT